MSTPYYEHMYDGWENKDLYIYTRNEDPEKDGPYKISNQANYLLH